MKYDFFISYTSEDITIAREINAILTANGYTTFFHEDDTEYGDPVLNKLDKELAASSYVIAICSDAYFKSKYATLEFYSFLNHHLTGNSQEDQSRLIPIKVKECKLDPIANNLTYIDLTKLSTKEDRKRELLEKLERKLEKSNKKLENQIAKNQSDPRVYNFPWSDHTKSETDPYYLQTYTPKDNKLFVSRGINTKPVEEIFTKLDKQETNLIYLQGPSGSGKSSLILAGLIPKLNQEKWEFVYFDFAQDPYKELATGIYLILHNLSLSSLGEDEIKLQIDQLANKLKEEKDELRKQFESIVSLYKGKRILLVADNIDKLYQPNYQEIHPDFLNLLHNSVSKFTSIAIIAICEEKKNESKEKTVRIQGFTNDTITELIKKPAQEKGIEFEQRVIDSIIKDLDTEKQSHNLVLLGAILIQLWDIKKKYELPKITAREYDDIGHVKNALNHLASEIFNKLNAEEKENAERFFLRMVNHIDENKKLINRSIIVGSEEYSSLIDKFSKILRTDKNGKEITVDFFHKKLAESWTMLPEAIKKEHYFSSAKEIEKDAASWYEQKANDKAGPILIFWKYFRSIKKWPPFIAYKKEKEISERCNYLFSQPQQVQDYLSWSVKWSNAFIICIAIILAISGYILNGYRNNGILEESFSNGDKSLFTSSDSNKQRGVNHFKNRNFKQAEDKFKESRNYNKNDPEALIYQNNAFLAWRRKSFSDSESFSISAVISSFLDSIPFSIAAVISSFLDSKLFSIAAIVPIGGNSEVSLEILRGIAHAQDELIKNYEAECAPNNNEKVCQEKFKQLFQVIIIDDGNDKTKAKEIAKHLINKKNEVLAVVGHNVSEVSTEAAIEYQKGGLLMISPTSFALDFKKLDTTYPDRSKKNYIFTATISHDVLANKLADVISNENKKTKILSCYDSTAMDQEAFVRTLEESKKYKFEIIKSLGGEHNQRCDFSKENTNLPQTLDLVNDLINKNKIGAILVAPHVNTIGDSIHLLRSIEKEKVKIYSSPTLFTNQTLLLGEKIVEGITLAVSWIPGSNKSKNACEFEKKAIELWSNDTKESDSENAREFERKAMEPCSNDTKESDSDPRILELNKIGVTWRSVGAYNATRAVIQGFNNDPISPFPTRESLSASLSSKNFILEKGVPDKIEFYNNCQENDKNCAVGKLKASNDDPLLVETKAVEKKQYKVLEFTVVNDKNSSLQKE